MKVTKHVELLLRQGRKPRELVELGFPKSVVTRVRRQLRNEQAAGQAKVPNGEVGVKNYPQPAAVSAARTAPIQLKRAYQEGDLQKPDNLIEAPPELVALVAAAQELGTYRRENCPYQEDGLCTLQIWTSQDQIPKAIGEPVLVEKTEKEKPRWYIKPSYFYCAMCTAFLEDRVADVESEVSGDPLSGARDEITCKSCGSKGFIATAIKCTKCGRQIWWGWVPK